MSSVPPPPPGCPPPMENVVEGAGAPALFLCPDECARGPRVAAGRVAQRALAALRPAEMLPKISSRPGAPSGTLAPSGKGGRGSTTAGRGGLALRARRVAGTLLRSGEGASWAPSRPGRDLLDRFGGLSGTSIVDEDGRAHPT